MDRATSPDRNGNICSIALDLGIMTEAIGQSVTRHTIRGVQSAPPHNCVEIIHMGEAKYRCGVGRHSKLAVCADRLRVIAHPIVAQDVTVIPKLLNDLGCHVEPGLLQ